MNPKVCASHHKRLLLRLLEITKEVRRKIGRDLKMVADVVDYLILVLNSMVDCGKSEATFPFFNNASKYDTGFRWIQ